MKNYHHLVLNSTNTLLSYNQSILLIYFIENIRYWKIIFENKFEGKNNPLILCYWKNALVIINIRILSINSYDIFSRITFVMKLPLSYIWLIFFFKWLVGRLLWITMKYWKVKISYIVLFYYWKVYLRARYIFHVE